MKPYRKNHNVFASRLFFWSFALFGSPKRGKKPKVSSSSMPSLFPTSKCERASVFGDTGEILDVNVFDAIKGAEVCEAKSYLENEGPLPAELFFLEEPEALAKLKKEQSKIKESGRSFIDKSELALEDRVFEPDNVSVIDAYAFACEFGSLGCSIFCSVASEAVDYEGEFYVSQVDAVASSVTQWGYSSVFQKSVSEQTPLFVRKHRGPRQSQPEFVSSLQYKSSFRLFHGYGKNMNRREFFGPQGGGGRLIKALVFRMKKQMIHGGCKSPENWNPCLIRVFINQPGDVFYFVTIIIEAKMTAEGRKMFKSADARIQMGLAVATETFKDLAPNEDFSLMIIYTNYPPRKNTVEIFEPEPQGQTLRIATEPSVIFDSPIILDQFSLGNSLL